MSAAPQVVTEVYHPENQRYLGRKLGEIADEEGKELGRVIIDISLKDDLDAEFTAVIKRTMESRQAIAGMACILRMAASLSRHCSAASTMPSAVEKVNSKNSPV